MTGISALIKEALESSSPLPPCEDTVKTAVCEPGSRTSPDPECAEALTLGFPAPRTVGNKFLLFISYPVYGILL